MRDDVLVIGAGVIGLSTAVVLAEAGWAVRVVAEEPPLATTSAMAGASWGPHDVDLDPRTRPWARDTRRFLEALVAEGGGHGVGLVRGREVASVPMAAPEWAAAVPGFSMCRPDELPEGYVVGWWNWLPMLDMPVYLRYLESRLARAGVRVQGGRVTSLESVAREARVTVNCTGLGAARLVDDFDLTGVRGQLVIVSNPGIEEYFDDNTPGELMTYVFPHPGYVVLGGIYAEGRSAEFDPAASEAIVARCEAVVPQVRDAEFIEHRIGLRPCRPVVRLEKSVAGGHPVIHNYGHGGSGVSLSWGCALEVGGLVKEILD